MSDTYSYTGKLIPIKFKDGQSVDEWIQDELETDELESYFSSWLEKLEDVRYNEYLYDATSGIMYKIEKEEFDVDSFIRMESNPDGSYDFVTSFYNGGTYLGEMLQDGIDEC